MVSIDKFTATRVQRLRNKSAGRDAAMVRVQQVRAGNLEYINPEAFSDAFPKSIVANFVDVAARGLGEALAPLPSLKCSSGANRTQADKRRGERKNRIGAYYWRESRLDVQMAFGADQFVSYGFLPFRLEADHVKQCPKIIVDDPDGVYYDLDRWGQCVLYARVWRQNAAELASLYADDVTIVGALTRGPYGEDLAETDVEVIHYMDGVREILYVPSRNNLELTNYQHGFGFCPAHIAIRPGLNKNPRGQFDDTIYIQVARAVFAALGLEAAHKAVQAPLVVPDDVTELPMGADAVITTNNPAGVGRVQLNVPREAFMFEQTLDQEQRVSGRFVEPSQLQANVITGRGVEAMMGTFDSQVKSAQNVLRLALETITGMAFRMDVTLWPRKRKTINGIISGESYQITYSPADDISDDFVCAVTYGFASGLSPQNAIVMLLQLRGDGLIDRDTFRRQLPFDLDTDAIQRHLDTEQTEDALKQGLFAALQASGQILASGNTELVMNLFSAASAVIQGRQQGKDIASILTSTFAAQQQAAQEAQQQAAAAQGGGAPGAPGADGGIPGVGSDGLPPNVAPGQAGMAPGGMPSIQSLVAGVTGGQAQMNATVRKRLPSG